MTKLHVLQHVPFEGPAHLGWWALRNGHKLARTQLRSGEALPELDGIDALAVLGGPMSVHDEETYPWLADEKAFLAQAVDEGLPVLGICLGAQLLAAALGGEVVPADEREVGWFPVELTAQAAKHAAFSDLPETFPALHWHGETVELPPEAVQLARSEACEHQAFALGDHVLGLQFHLEMGPGDVLQIAEACPGDLEPGRYVQTVDEMTAEPKRFLEANGHLEGILDGWWS